MTEQQGDIFNYLGNLTHNVKMYVRDLDNKAMLLRRNVSCVRKFFTISEISILVSIYDVTRPSLI